MAAGEAIVLQRASRGVAETCNVRRAVTLRFPHAHSSLFPRSDVTFEMHEPESEKKRLLLEHEKTVSSVTHTHTHPSRRRPEKGRVNAPPTPARTYTRIDPEPRDERSGENHPRTCNYMSTKNVMEYM